MLEFIPLLSRIDISLKKVVQKFAWPWIAQMLLSRVWMETIWILLGSTLLIGVTALPLTTVAGNIKRVLTENRQGNINQTFLF